MIFLVPAIIINVVKWKKKKEKEQADRPKGNNRIKDKEVKALKWEPTKPQLIGGLVVSVIPVGVIMAKTGTDSVLLAIGIWASYMLPILAMIYYILKKRNAPYEKIMQQVQFFEECKKNNIHDLTSATNKQKAELIAQRLGCRGYTSIEAFLKKVACYTGKRIRKTKRTGTPRCLQKPAQRNWPSIPA